MKGIDVSYAQGVVNWAAIAADGVEFAIVKASQGRLLADRNSGSFRDPQFYRNVVGASDSGIAVGVYHYLTAENVQEAVEEAEYFVNTIYPYRDRITLWAVCDAEEDEYLPKDRALLGEMIEAFLTRVAEAGFAPMLYANPNYLTYRLPDMSHWPLWLAYWGVPEVKALAYDPLIWQYGGETLGDLSGVDVNKGYFEIPKATAKEDNEMSKPKNEWWEEPLAWAQKNGIIFGDENGDLMLNEPCTRRQMVTFLYRLYNLVTKGSVE